MKTLAFAGSNSSTSINHQLINYLALSSNNDIKVIKLSNYEIPIYSEDLEKTTGIPQSVKNLNAKLSEVDKLIISVNEHNGNVSACFKNVLDWLSRNDRNFLTGKKIIILSASPGVGGAKSALSITEKTLPYFGAEVIATLSIASFYDVFKNGEIINLNIEKQLKEIINKM